MSIGIRDLANFTKALNDEEVLIGQHLAALSSTGPYASPTRMELELQRLAAKVTSLEASSHLNLGIGNQLHSSSANEEIASLEIKSSY